MAQVWWQNVSNAIAGSVTPQQAMDGLARDQDAIMTRIQRSGVQGDLGPVMNKPRDAEYWYKYAETHGNPGTAAQARQREAARRDGGLRRAHQELVRSGKQQDLRLG